MSANLLWAHLLRKDAATTDTPSQIPPIAPQDRAGTSMRMLIHDTQVNLEKFSARLDGLLQRVDECKTQVVNANKLLDVERDKVLTEMLDLAHKCRTEMKAHVGTPAQATELKLVQVAQASTEKSVQAMEKRIDALQTLLRTQAHVMQSIQDQQNTLIGAILPLTTIVHGVPAQMEQIRTALSDVVTAMTGSTEGVRSIPVAERTESRSRRRRPHVPVLDPDVPPFSPLGSRGREPSLKRTRVDQVETVPLRRKTSRLAGPLPVSGDPRPIVQTPRRPLEPDVQHCVESLTTRERSTAPHEVEFYTLDGRRRSADVDQLGVGPAPIEMASGVRSTPLRPRAGQHQAAGSSEAIGPLPSMSLRDRKAQMSRFGRQETRRFIPLVPWSDEEE